MFADFDFDVIIRSLPYLFYDGMTFTLTLTVLATIGGIVFGTLLALMRLSGIAPLALLAAIYIVINIIVTFGMRWVERRSAVPGMIGAPAPVSTH